MLRYGAGLGIVVGSGCCQVAHKRGNSRQEQLKHCTIYRLQKGIYKIYVLGAQKGRASLNTG